MLGFARMNLQQRGQTGRLAPTQVHRAPLAGQASLISDPAGWVCLLKTIRARMHDLHLAASPSYVLPTHTYRPRIEEKGWERGLFLQNLTFNSGHIYC